MTKNEYDQNHVASVSRQMLTKDSSASIDLGGEMQTAVARVEQRHLDWIMGNGASAMAIASLGATQEPFGIGCLEFVGTDYWQPHSGPAAIGAVIQPVYDGGDIIDLIAWRSLKPLDWRWRVGEGWALGTDCLQGSAWLGFNSITVHATPLAWLVAGGEGLTILNWTSSSLYQLSQFDEIVCSDGKVAARLNNILSRPARVPSIIRGVTS